MDNIVNSLFDIINQNIDKCLFLFAKWEYRKNWNNKTFPNSVITILCNMELEEGRSESTSKQIIETTIRSPITTTSRGSETFNRKWFSHLPVATQGHSFEAHHYIRWPFTSSIVPHMILPSKNYCRMYENRMTKIGGKTKTFHGSSENNIALASVT